MNASVKSITGKSIREWMASRHLRELILVFVIQAFSLFSSLGISLLVTNLLGAAAYGVFSYSFSWVNLLAVFSCMGFEQLALKELPAYQVHQRKDLIRGYFNYATRRVLIISVLVSLFLFSISFLAKEPADELLRYGLWLAIPVLPFISMINLRFSWLRAFHFNSLSQFPDKVLRPFLFLLLLAIAYLVFREALNVWMVIIISGCSIVAALVMGNYFVVKKVTSTTGSADPAFERKQWRNVAFSLFLVNGIYFYLSQLQILLLGSFRGAEETGIFAIASRLSDLEGYVLFALNVVLAPLISRLFAEGKMKELQSLITKSLWFGFFFSAPVVICFLSFPAFFLHFFGDEFGAGSFMLIILTISQVVNFATGSVGYLLTMTGHHKTAIQVLIFCALSTTVISFLLVPSFGMNGAAIAAAINNVVLNVAMALAVYQKTGINSTLLRLK